MKQISERVRLLNEREENRDADYVLYWMQMFKRTTNNHALKFAVEAANERKLPLVVYEGLKYYYPWANDRLHTYILEGVEEKRRAFEKMGVRYVFYLQKDKNSPKQTVKKLSAHAALLVTDDFPCFIIPDHNRAIVEKATIPVYAVDSNGVVPMSLFEKEEYAARTIRPKINRILGDYLKPFEEARVEIKKPNLQVDCPDTEVTEKNLSKLVGECAIDHTVAPSPIYHGGERNAHRRLKHFLTKILPVYDETRSRPEIDGVSRLSSYLHFGFISPLEIALAVKDADAPKKTKDAYLEELIVRRELSYNFTRHNSHYDSLKALPDWALKTMREHEKDERPEIFTLKELEACETYDELWNATQREINLTGECHNYVRMLWGKLVIQWSKNYEEAFKALDDLNNRLCLDGRNPNSYAGILWCFGKHDQAWKERPIFGKLRFMTSASTGKKFDSAAYIEWTRNLEKNPELPPVYHARK
jgi:deoxyribodipyrimidine photo-lyase